MQPTLCRQYGRKGTGRTPEIWDGLYLGTSRSTVEKSQTENPTSTQTASYRVLSLSGTQPLRFCPGLSLHQPVSSLFARQGSYTCTANHTKFSELETGWSGKPAFTRGWTTHQPTAHKVTYLSGYIFQMQMCPPQPACSTSAFYSCSQPTRCLLAVFLIISSFHSGPRSELTQ